SYNLPWGGTASTAGVYTHTYATASGCDSILNITLSVGAVSTTNVNAQICQGASYNLPWGGTANTTATYTHTYNTTSGCDSVVNIALAVDPVFTTNRNAQICSGTSYNLPWGGTASTAGVYTHTYATASGGDSILNITLSVGAVSTTNVNAQICQGAVYNLPWGGTANTTATYTHTYNTTSGCDSVVNIALAVDPVFTTNQNAQICSGDSYNLPWGGTASTAGVYSHTYATVNGCDSILNITVVINSIFTTNQNVQICTGSTFTLPWGGTVNTAGTYSHTYNTASGCDSLVNITLVIGSTFITNQNA